MPTDPREVARSDDRLRMAEGASAWSKRRVSRPFNYPELVIGPATSGRTRWLAWLTSDGPPSPLCGAG